MVVGPEVKTFCRLHKRKQGREFGNKVTIKLNGETVDEKTAEKYFRYLSPEFNNSGNLFNQVLHAGYLKAKKASK